MDAATYLTALRTDGTALVDAATAHLDRPVPGCPGWTAADLLAHTGRVHRWAAGVVRDRVTSRPSRPPAPPAAGLGDWYREGLDQLLTALDDDPTAEVWTWAGPGHVSFWQRRMAQETAVHRWDAESTAGEPAPIDPAIAADGIDEMLDVFARVDARGGRLTDTGTVHVHTTDAEGEWWLRVVDGDLDLRREHAKGDVALRGPASDVLLVLWGRRPLSTIDAVGDTSVWERWQAQLER